MNYRVVCSLLLGLGLAALPALAEDKPEASPAPAQAPADGKEVVARVNDETITRAEVDKTLQRMSRGMVPPEEQRAEMEKAVLNQLIDQKVLTQKAKTVKIDDLDGKVAKEMADLKGRFPSEEIFKQVLSQQGIDEAELKQNITDGVRIDALIDQDVRSKIAVTDAEKKEFYEKNPQYFAQPAQVQASHILVKVPEGADDTVKAEKRAAIDKARERVVGGEDFAKVAAEVSECPSKAKGGDLGMFGEGQMVKPFEEAAFALKDGQISDVVTTQFGYHVIKKTGSKEASTVPFEEEKEKITEFLQNQKAQEAVQAYVADLRKEAKVEVLLK